MYDYIIKILPLVIVLKLHHLYYATIRPFLSAVLAGTKFWSQKPRIILIEVSLYFIYAGRTKFWLQKPRIIEFGG